MKVITILGTAFSGSAGIAAGIASKTGYKVLSDNEIIDETIKKHGFSRRLLEKALHHRSGVSGGGNAPKKRRAVAALKLTLAEKIVRGKYVYAGHLGHLIPENISLRVLMVADLAERIGILRARRANGPIKEKQALMTIKKQDKRLNAWNRYLWERDLCENTPYDLILQSSDAHDDRTQDRILRGLSAKKERTGSLSETSAGNFLLASRVALAASRQSHDVTVTADNGAISITINRHCIMLNALKRKLRGIAGDVPGVKTAKIGVGKKFYRSNICRGTDFLLPEDNIGAGRLKRNSMFYLHAFGTNPKGA